jgi:hypothetical protein
VSFINNIWNPFDSFETLQLVEYIKMYIDSVYITEENLGDILFGLKEVKTLLNSVIEKYLKLIETLQLPTLDASNA